MNRTFAAAIGMVLMAAGSGFAESIVYPLQESRVIQDGRGASRLLMSFGGLGEVPGTLVTSATLACTLSGSTPDETFVVRLAGLETDWAGRGATWTTPWQREGGDLSAARSASEIFAKDRPARAMVFDVSEIVQGYADGETALHGFALIVPESKADGMTAAELGIVQTLVRAELKVSYRNIAAYGFTSSRNPQQARGR